MASFNINWNNGRSQSITLSQNVDLSFSSGVIGNNYLLQRSTTGSYSASWPQEVLWPNDIEPAQTLISGSKDVFTFFFDGTCYHGRAFGLDYTPP